MLSAYAATVKCLTRDGTECERVRQWVAACHAALVHSERALTDVLDGCADSPVGSGAPGPADSGDVDLGLVAAVLLSLVGLAVLLLLFRRACKVPIHCEPGRDIVQPITQVLVYPPRHGLTLLPVGQSRRSLQVTAQRSGEASGPSDLWEVVEVGML